MSETNGSRAFSTAVTTILAICALIITALVVRREFFVPNQTPDPLEVKKELEVAVWQKVSEQGPVIGPKNARVKIVEFYDYECPFCRKIQPALDEIREKYPDDVAIIHRHFPLQFHLNAFPAAIAAECADSQDRFEAYHGLLFEKQDSLADLQWDRLAQAVGVPDLPRFRECVEQAIPSVRVTTDKNLAQTLEINSIPTLIVNGKLYTGALSVDQLEEITQQALSEDK